MPSFLQIYTALETLPLHIYESHYTCGYSSHYDNNILANYLLLHSYIANYYVIVTCDGCI